MLFSRSPRRRRRPVQLDSAASGQIARLALETLELRVFLDATANQLIGVNALRADPQFADIDGRNMTIAVIDTGVDRTHPLIQSNYKTGFDFKTKTVNYTLPQNGTGDFAHGTHVAGIAASSDPNTGVAPKAGIVGLQAFDVRQGMTRPGAFYRNDALQWVLDSVRGVNDPSRGLNNPNGTKNPLNIVAINMSLGSNQVAQNGSQTPFTTEQQGQQLDPDGYRLVKALEAVGVTVVSAAGNDYDKFQTPGVAVPAIYSTLAVGAVYTSDPANSGLTRQAWGNAQARDNSTGADRLVFFSERFTGSNVLFAPGAWIQSSVPGGGTARFPGTSMASPAVAGAVALVQQAAQKFLGSTLSPTQLRDLLITTGDQIFDGDDEDDTVTNTNTNYRRLNVYNAVKAIRDQANSRNPGGGGGGVTPTNDLNGTFQTAADIGPIDGSLDGTYLNGRVGTDYGTNQVGGKDVDMFKFTVARPLTIQAVVANGEGSSNLDVTLRLFSAGGTQLAMASQQISGGGATVSTSTSADLQPGTYYVGVSAFANKTYSPTSAGSGPSGNMSDYRLKLQVASGGGLGFDPNGVLAGAVEANLGSQPNYAARFDGTIYYDYGQLVGPQDVDIFKVVLPDTGSLYVDIDTPFPTDAVDSFLRVFDANGNQVAFSDDDRAPDEPPHEFDDTVRDAQGNIIGHRTDSFAFGQNLARGSVFYIAVSDFENQLYDPKSLAGRNGTGFGGLYSLFLSFVSRDLNGSIQQALGGSIVPLPTVRNPGIIGSDGMAGGGIQEVGDKDVDFVKVNSPTAGILEIDIDSYSLLSDPFINNQPVDTVVMIWDSTGKLLAANDNDGTTRDALLRFQIAAGTDYYVSISGYGNDSFDPKRLGSGIGGSTGQYYYSQKLLPLSAKTDLGDNDSRSRSVRTLSVGSEIDGAIGYDDGIVLDATDIDFYRFTAPSTGTFEFRSAPNDSMSADTYLRIFDSNGNQLPGGANDNAASDFWGSVLTISLQAGQTYFVGVNGASASAGQYTLDGSNAAAGAQGSYTISVVNTSTPAPTIGSPTRMYRAYNPNADYHFFTTSQAEFDNAVRAGYRDETSSHTGFNVLAQQESGATVIFRLYNLQTGRHYYTTNAGERDGLVAIIPPPATGPDTRTVGWRYEKNEGFLFPSAIPGTTEIFRLYNNNSGVHLYTEDVNVKNGILAQFPGVWVQHSSFGYAMATGGATGSAGSVTVASLFAPELPVTTSSTATVADAVTFTDVNLGLIAAPASTASSTTLPLEEASDQSPAVPVATGSSTDTESDLLDDLFSDLADLLPLLSATPAG